MRIYVGNLAYEVTSYELEDLFGQHGKVESAEVITDRQSGRSKGFGFVEMPTQEEAEAAIAALNGTDFRGRKLTVNEARARTERPFGSRGPSRRW